MKPNTLDHESVYEFGVDTDADAVIDIAFRVRFSPVVRNSQTASVQLATGQHAAADVNAGKRIIRDAPITFGTEPKIAAAGDFRFFAGLRFASGHRGSSSSRPGSTSRRATTSPTSASC
jgi:hypothetical protein